MDIYTVKFNGNDISQIGGVDLYNHEFNRLPERDIRINKVARRDLSIITSAEYTQKEVTVNMDVCSGSRPDTEDTLTFLKSLLQAQNSPLVVSQGGTEVEYTATLNEMNIEWSGVTAIVEIVFIASDPIGKEVATQSMATITGITTSTATLSMTVLGSATAYPVINVVVNSVTGGTGGQITILNGRTNQGIRIDHDFVDGDIIEIDSMNMRVTINGTLTDFTGMFPQFPAGSQQIKYVDSFTTRNVDLTSTYQPRIV